MIEEAIARLLLTDPAIAEAVGDRGIGVVEGGQVWPLERTQGTKTPAITYQRSGGVRDYDMQGATRLVESRFLINCFGEKTKSKSGYKAAKELARQVETVFSPDDGFRQTLGMGFSMDFTADAYAIAAVEIQGIFINNEDDTRTDGATGIGVARVFLDCTFWHKQI